jgi:hypothetical protein
MLDQFLEHAYEGAQKTAQSNELASLMKRVGIPAGDLLKLATGQVKLADLECVKSSDDSTGNSWLDKFRGTPLLPQALALCEEDIKIETQQIQSRLAQPPEPEFYTLRDQLRLRKKLLELELVKEQNGASGAGAAPNPGALPGAADAPVPAMPDSGAGNVTQMDAPKTANMALGNPQQVQRAAAGMGAAQPPPMAQPGGLQTPAQKLAAAMLKEALSNSTVSSFAQKTLERGVSPGHLDKLKTLGTSLVNKGSQMNGGVAGGTAGKLVGQGANLLSKLSSPEMLTGVVDLAKELAHADSSKAAGADIEKAAAGMLDAVKGYAAAHPGVVMGAAGGALGGAAQGLKKDQNGERHVIGGALKGGVVGGAGAAALTHGKPVYDAARAGGAGVGDALKATGKAGIDAAKPLVDRMRGAVGI